MTGHVRKKGDSWYYSFEGAKVGGKRKKIERYGGTIKKDAESALRKAITEYENAGVLFEPVDVSVSDFFDYWMKNYVLVNLRYNTREAYRVIID